MSDHLPRHDRLLREHVHDPYQLPRHDRLLEEHVHDPYQARRKLAEPCHCPGCGAIYHRGRWQWSEVAAHADSHEETCPACRRIADDCPAGIVVLEGPYVTDHADELTSLARHTQQRETNEHPLHRIMAIEEESGKLTITTTDIHLPLIIGKAIHHAQHGELTVHHAPEDYFVRVHWRR